MKHDSGAEGEYISMPGNDCAASKQNGCRWQAGGVHSGVSFCKNQIEGTIFLDCCSLVSLDGKAKETCCQAIYCYVINPNCGRLERIAQAEPLLAWLRQTVTDYEAFIVAARLVICLETWD